MLLQGIRIIIIIIIIIMHSCIVYSISEVVFILCGFLFIFSLMVFAFVFSCFLLPIISCSCPICRSLSHVAIFVARISRSLYVLFVN